MSAERRIGLARALSKLGYCSRSQAFQLIRNGEVKLNGRIRTDPETAVREGKDVIEVRGIRVAAAAKHYLMMNKPRGVVTSAADEKGRQTVLDLLPKNLPFLSPVGRLDKASEGLLLFTNDSEWAARITAPESHLPKTYHVQVDSIVANSVPHQMENGVTSKGDFLKVDSATAIRQGTKTAWLEVVLCEGRNRQIRRICDELDLQVLRLIRIAIGQVLLGNLSKGSVRPLTGIEKKSLDADLSNRRTSPRNR